jgi:hypothetical protein
MKCYLFETLPPARGEGKHGMQAREDLFFENFETHQAQHEEEAGNPDAGIDGGMMPGMNGPGGMINPMALMGMQQVPRPTRHSQELTFQRPNASCVAFLHLPRNSTFNAASVCISTCLT